MAKVLIAYNDDVSERSRQFFDACATDIRNFCYTHGLECELLSPPKLTHDEFISIAKSSEICYVVAHGTPNSILNEKEEDVLSIYTTNYDLCGKALFAVSCFCAQSLKEELLRIGMKLFVGYRHKYTEFPEYEEFMESANSGIKAFFTGANVYQMRQIMNAEYDRLYEELDSKNPLAADSLFDNKEALVIEGDDELVINDLT